MRRNDILTATVFLTLSLWAQGAWAQSTAHVCTNGRTAGYLSYFKTGSAPTAAKRMSKKGTFCVAPQRAPAWGVRNERKVGCHNKNHTLFSYLFFKNGTVITKLFPKSKQYLDAERPGRVYGCAVVTSPTKLECSRDRAATIGSFPKLKSKYASQYGVGGYTCVQARKPVNGPRPCADGRFQLVSAQKYFPHVASAPPGITHKKVLKVNGVRSTCIRVTKPRVVRATQGSRA